MNTLRGLRSPDTTPTTVKRSRPLVVSIVVHAIVVLALVRFLISPAIFTFVFGSQRSPEVPAERIGFLRLPKSTGPAVEGRSGGDNRPVSKSPPPRLLAPPPIPTVVPPIAPETKTAEPEGGSGPLVGTGGPARG